MALECRIRCSISDGSAWFTFGECSQLQAPLHVAKRSQTFCNALETADGDDFCIVAPEEFLQSWLGVACESAHELSLYLRAVKTNDVAKFLQVNNTLLIIRAYSEALPVCDDECDRSYAMLQP